jgi:uncharacterized protein YydD (DUF2326 family)
MKSLTVSERKKILATIRFLKTQSWNSTKSEIESIRKQIHELQNKLEMDDLNSKNMRSKGLKKPSVRGLKTVCTRVVKATGLKVDGTLKKGYKYIKGGKVVKVAQPKKPVKKRVVKRVAKAKTPKRRVVRKRKVRRAA